MLKKGAFWALHTRHLQNGTAPRGLEVTRGYEIMFHVSTLLPYTDGDTQQVCTHSSLTYDMRLEVMVI